MGKDEDKAGQGGEGDTGQMEIRKGKERREASEMNGGRLM